MGLDVYLTRICKGRSEDQRGFFSALSNYQMVQFYCPRPGPQYCFLLPLFLSGVATLYFAENDLHLVSSCKYSHYYFHVQLLNVFVMKQHNQAASIPGLQRSTDVRVQRQLLRSIINTTATVLKLMGWKGKFQQQSITRNKFLPLMETTFKETLQICLHKKSM